MQYTQSKQDRHSIALIPALLMLAMPLLASGCSHNAANSSFVNRSSPAKSGIKLLPVNTQTLAVAKVTETGGDYRKLTPSEQQQLDLVSQGHGRMIFELAKKK